MADCIKCPRCDSIDCGKIIYGMPSHELFEQAEAAKIKLGGCIILDDNPDHFCRNCGYEWKEASHDDRL